MQTRTLGLRGIALALAGVLTLGLTACDETDVIQPDPVSTIQVSPAGPLDLQVGNTVQLVTNVTNPAQAGAQPTYASSNPAVATVTAAGVVTAVSAGTATITVTAQGRQGALQQGVLVRVTGVTPPTPGPAPRVLIQSIQTAQGTAVNTSAVQGQIFVRLQVERGNADSLQVRLGNEIVCRQSFVTGASGDPVADAAEFVCPINTAQLNADGTARFPNAATTISAHLFRGGSIVDSASQPVTLANVAVAAIGITADTTAIGQDGFLWHRGALAVTISPATFAPGQTLGTATIIVTDRRTDTQIASRQITTSPFQTTFAVTGAAQVAALAGLTTDSLEVRVVTTTAAGAAGPTATRVIRYDNVAPEAPFTIARPTGFVGTGFTFATTATGAGTALGVTPLDVMPGSGNVTVTFHVVPVTTANNALTAAQIVAQGTQVTGADQLEETAAGYRLVARARDAVGNVRLSNIIEGLRVDRTAPSIVTVGLAQNQIFNTPIAAGTTFSVNVQDDESGFNAAAALRVTATRLSAAGTQCFNAATGALTAQPCSAVTTGLSLRLPSGTNYGYYTYTIQPVDRAGNVGEAVTRTILYDAAAPTVSNINFPVGTTGGANTTFTATIADNLDLRAYTFGFFFGDPNATHFGALPVESVVIDDTFGAPLTTTHAASVTTPYIRGLWSEGVWYPSTTVVFTAQDMARLTANGAFAIPTQTTSPSLRADITTFAIVAPAENATFSNTGTGTTAPTSRTITARATSNDTQATVPYTRVHFYEVVAGNRRLIGTATTATPIVGPTERTFDYSITYAPAGVPAGTVQIFAVGVQANGDARRTDNVRNVEIQGTL